MSSDDDNDDDEVINGTPQPVQIIKDRYKKTNRLSRSSHPERARHSNAVTPVNISPRKSDVILPVLEDGNTVSIRKLTKGTSPLRRIENKNTKEVESPKWFGKTPTKKPNEIISTVMEPKSKARTSTSPQKKFRNLSLGNRNKLKQTTIPFESAAAAVKMENRSTPSKKLLADVSSLCIKVKFLCFKVFFACI